LTPSRGPLAGGRGKERTHEISSHEERTGPASGHGRRFACRSERRREQEPAPEGGLDCRRGRRTHGGQRGHLLDPTAHGRRVRRRRAAQGVGTPTRVALTAAVDPSRRLSEGALVQASVRARLLGIPLLRLDATVALMPATITARSSSLAAGNGLAEAVRSINDGAEVLAQLRQNGRR
jgi:hypothetical protein